MRVTIMRAGAFSLTLLLGATVHAAGFYLSEVGTPASLGTGGAANVTNDFGPDATWANPAGLTGVEDGVFTTGLQIIAPVMEFDASLAEAGGDDGDNAAPAAVVPSFFYHRQLSDEWHLGFGISGMQGGGLDYGNNFAGRYGAKTVELEAIGTTFSVGWEVTDRLSVGAGVSAVYTLFSQEIAINQGTLPDGQVKFDELDDWGFQPIVGMQYDLTDQLKFGVTWRGEFDAELRGDVKFTTVLPLPAETNLELDWTNPQWLEAGLKYTPEPGHHWLLMANWQEWSEFSENQITVDVGSTSGNTTLDRDWDDTYGVAIGYARTPIKYGYGWSVGVAYESSPVEDDKRTIDMPMDESWKISAAFGNQRENKFDWSVGASLYFYGDAELDQTSQGVRLTGDFNQNMILFLGATARF